MLHDPLQLLLQRGIVQLQEAGEGQALQGVFVACGPPFAASASPPASSPPWQCGLGGHQQLCPAVGDTHLATAACPRPSPWPGPGRRAWSQGSPQTACLDPQKNTCHGEAGGTPKPIPGWDKPPTPQPPAWGWVHSPQPARKRRSPEKRQGGLPKGSPSSTYTMWPTVWPGVASASKVRQPTLTFSLSVSGLCRNRGHHQRAPPNPSTSKYPAPLATPPAHRCQERARSLPSVVLGGWTGG